MKLRSQIEPDLNRPRNARPHVHHLAVYRSTGVSGFGWSRRRAYETAVFLGRVRSHGLRVGEMNIWPRGLRNQFSGEDGTMTEPIPTTITLLPLRRIVREVPGELYGVRRDLLECGHTMSHASGIYGQCHSERCRCRKCAAGKRAGMDVSSI